MESDNKNIQEQLQIVTDWCMASLIDQQASSSSILPAALAALWGTKPGIIYYVLVVANLAETSVSIPSVTRITLLKIDVVNNTYSHLAETSVSIPSVTRITLLKIDVVNNTYSHLAETSVSIPSVTRITYMKC